MTLAQGLSFALIAATVGCFVWGRLPYDLVAVAALFVGVVIGVVPARSAFEGFSDEVVIIIAAALVVSAGIARSGIVEAAMRPITPRLRTVSVQVPVLVGAVLVLSMVTKNVGALAIFMPVVPVAIAFFGAAVALLLLRVLTMHEAYGAVEWHVLILIGALIPISHAVRDSGGTDLIAGLLLPVVHGLPGIWALGAVLVLTLIVTPFLHNAPTVLIMGPIAASLAVKLGFSVDSFLMAVALGAGCDFLTPIGHQCNTLVMGPGGYRFGDYARLGAPLSLLVVAVGLPVLTVFWPLGHH